MKNPFRIISVLILSLAVLTLAGSAKAADEQANISFGMTPSGGTLYKEALRPVEWQIGIDINAPLTSPKVTPMKKVKINFPKEMKFKPGNTGVCPDSKLSNIAPLASGPSYFAKTCSSAVIGNGSAAIWITGANAPAPQIQDAQVLVFNAGYRNGNPAIKIYAFSKSTGVGVYMLGVLNKKNEMTINVPVLSYDSALARLEMNIPGTDNPEPLFRGKNARFVQTTCKNGAWPFSMNMTLGTRDPSTGTPTGPDSYLNPSTSTSCIGAVGKANLVRPNVKGPKAVKQGRKGVYRVTVRNNGTATAKAVRLRVQGRAARINRFLGKISPGASKTVRLAVKPRGRKGARIKVVFRVSGQKIAAKKISKVIRIK